MFLFEKKKSSSIRNREQEKGNVVIIDNNNDTRYINQIKFVAYYIIYLINKNGDLSQFI